MRWQCRNRAQSACWAWGSRALSATAGEDGAKGECDDSGNLLTRASSQHHEDRSGLLLLGSHHDLERKTPNVDLLLAPVDCDTSTGAGGGESQSATRIANFCAAHPACCLARHDSRLRNLARQRRGFDPGYFLVSVGRWLRPKSSAPCSGNAIHSCSSV